MIGKHGTNEGCGRRGFLTACLGGCLAAGGLIPQVHAAVPSESPPRKGDRFVVVEGARAGRIIRPQDLKPGARPVLAWPFDPAAGVARSAAIRNEIILLRLRPQDLGHDAATRRLGGIVAYSAICTHAGCPVTDWLPQRHLLHCLCHGSEYDPAQGAKVVFGPAPRALPRLPVAIENGTLVVAGAFTSRVGGIQGGMQSRTD